MTEEQDCLLITFDHLCPLQNIVHNATGAKFLKIRLLSDTADDQKYSANILS